MRRLILLSAAALLLFSCEKNENKSYDESLTETINVKSVAMETIYQLVNLHIVNAQNDSFFISHCVSVQSDTIGGTVFDTVSFNPDSQCPYLLIGNSSGGYTSSYPDPFPGIAQTVTIKLSNFATNGYTVSGNLNYTFTSASHALISVSDLVITNEDGSTSVNASFNLTIAPDNNIITGSITGTGDHPFTWNSTSEMLADNDHATYNFYGNFLIHTGLGTLISGEKILTENYGNGQEDDLVIFENQEMDRRAFVLPRL